MQGRATAPAAGTVLNALATGRGSAFAIDLETTASVELSDTGSITGEITDAEDAESTLIERCCALVLDRYADESDRLSRAGVDPKDLGAHVRTESDVPVAAGLKSSSAAANATVLATLDALDMASSVEPLSACRLGIEAARDAGVTVTGAFDDASASMLGGLTVTDNREDELIAHDEPPWTHAAVYTPPSQVFSADVDVDACKQVSRLAHLVEELALDTRYAEAMCVNGLAFAAALDAPLEPILDALATADAVSLSGTGPSYVAVGDERTLEGVLTRWADRRGTTHLVRTRSHGGTLS